MADYFEEDFIRGADHIYILIHVVDAHTYFLGFAFGTDKFEYHEGQFGWDQSGYEPKVLRTLEELLVLLPDKALTTCNDAAV